MRRLLLLLIGLLAFGATLPAAPVAAAPAHHHAMPPGHCPDEGQGSVIHTCLGCAIDPVDPAPVELPPVAAMPAPVARLVSILPDHRPGFDPPPPRAA